MVRAVGGSIHKLKGVNMTDFITSLIRTYVPIAVGAFLGFLATLGLEVDAGVQTSLVVAITGLLQGLYYLVARLLETRWPQLGFLLGSTKKPEYYEE